MKLSKRLPKKYSAIFLILIFVLALGFGLWLHYIFNIQYQAAKPFSAGPLTLLPKTLRLDLEQPGDENLVFDASILVSGKASPFKQILIYTDSENLVIESKSDGSFSTLLNLKGGVNKITVVVFDNNGDSKTESRIVYFSEEKI